MAESLKKLKELFDLKDADLRTYSPLTLAYIGDGVYELVIRTILVKKANCPVNRLHKKASSLVKASAQSGMMEILEPLLTEEEKSVYRRGRNAHSATMANAILEGKQGEQAEEAAAEKEAEEEAEANA